METNIESHQTIKAVFSILIIDLQLISHAIKYVLTFVSCCICCFTSIVPSEIFQRKDSQICARSLIHICLILQKCAWQSTSEKVAECVSGKLNKHALAILQNILPHIFRTAPDIIDFHIHDWLRMLKWYIYIYMHVYSHASHRIAKHHQGFHSLVSDLLVDVCINPSDVIIWVMAVTCWCPLGTKMHTLKSSSNV